MHLSKFQGMHFISLVISRHLPLSAGSCENSLAECFWLCVESIKNSGLAIPFSLIIAGMTTPSATNSAFTLPGASDIPWQQVNGFSCQANAGFSTRIIHRLPWWRDLFSTSCASTKLAQSWTHRYGLVWLKSVHLLLLRSEKFVVALNDGNCWVYRVYRACAFEAKNMTGLAFQRWLFHARNVGFRVAASWSSPLSCGDAVDEVLVSQWMRSSSRRQRDPSGSLIHLVFGELDKLDNSFTASNILKLGKLQKGPLKDWKTAILAPSQP